MRMRGVGEQTEKKRKLGEIAMVVERRGRSKKRNFVTAKKWSNMKKCKEGTEARTKTENCESENGERWGNVMKE